jgi:hypothetical protein
MANPMPPSSRRFLRHLASALVVACVVIVGVFAALKVRFGDDPPLGMSSSWPELFYGPALTASSSYLLVVIIVWLQVRIVAWSEYRKRQKR